VWGEGEENERGFFLFDLDYNELGIGCDWNKESI